VPEAEDLLGVLVTVVEVLGHIRSVGAALFLRSQDAEAGATGLREAPVHEAPIGLLGHCRIDGMPYGGTRRPIPLLGSEEQFRKFLEVVFYRGHGLKVPRGGLLQQPIHLSA
jgi:hypothetical protein